MHRIIGERDLADTPFGEDLARELYRDMVLARRFDERAVALQRRGWMSSYPPFRGQEASQVGAASALTADDWLFPTYRSNAMQIARGVPMSDILRFRRGYPEFESEHDLPTFPQTIPIASQIPQAAGVGMAMNYTDDDGAVLSYFGDGATSEGDFHEGLNFAGVFDAPVVFFCENNGWAISQPRSQQTASHTIADKANAYGFQGGQVDGNDPLAVHEIVVTALAKARNEEPVLIESLTYRQGAHTTSDDPSRYRDREGDLPDWRTRDPLERYEEYLREQDVADDEFVEAVNENADEKLDRAVDRAESAAQSSPADLFESVYGSLSDRLQHQKEDLETLAADHDLQELEH
ncbi:MAG: pyruvate dehydrogenase E1 component alpha subunit [Halobacteriales archaeon]|jgi:pyruvate dehydrogenase E1 component alpha subunit